MSYLPTILSPSDIYTNRHLPHILETIQSLQGSQLDAIDLTVGEL